MMNLYNNINNIMHRLSILINIYKQFYLLNIIGIRVGTSKPDLTMVKMYCI